MREGKRKRKERGQGRNKKKGQVMFHVKAHGKQLKEKATYGSSIP